MVRRFRAVLALGVGLVSLLASAQVAKSKQLNEYHPRRGETDLELTVAHRGDIVIELFTDKAPKASAHVAELAKAGFYDTQKFFKVLKSPKPYLVQVGDPDSRDPSIDINTLGNGGSGTTVPFENSGAPYAVGYVALATRGGDRDTGDSQFYILLGDYDKLLAGTATVFGLVVKGMNVVEKIEVGDQISAVKVVTG
jgi:cyclophilin family peptidyl-prolyl cis-trans isomerase